MTDAKRMLVEQALSTPGQPVQLTVSPYDTVGGAASKFIERLWVDNQAVDLRHHVPFSESECELPVEELVEVLRRRFELGEAMQLGARLE